MKYKNSKNQKLEKLEQFTKNSIQDMFWEVFQKNAIICYKLKRHHNNSTKFIV
jgi:hypothetical protein